MLEDIIRWIAQLDWSTNCTSLTVSLINDHRCIAFVKDSNAILFAMQIVCTVNFAIQTNRLDVCLDIQWKSPAFSSESYWFCSILTRFVCSTCLSMTSELWVEMHLATPLIPAGVICRLLSDSLSSYQLKQKNLLELGLALQGRPWKLSRILTSGSPQTELANQTWYLPSPIAISDFKLLEFAKQSSFTCWSLYGNVKEDKLPFRLPCRARKWD